MGRWKWLENKNTLSEWYWIMSNAVLFSKDLTDKQKLLYCLISSLCAENWYCRASNEYLGEKLNADKKTISRNVSTLAEKWYIFIEISPEQWNKRKITMDKNEDRGMDKNENTYTQKCGEGYGQKCPDNIISMNITNEYLFSTYYWKRKWIDKWACKKQIEEILRQWTTLEELHKCMVLYNCECRLKQEWYYVMKLETWLNEFQPLTDEEIESWIREIAKIYKSKLNSDSKFQTSSIAKDTWNELIGTFGEEKIKWIWRSEWKNSITLNLS